MASRQGGPWRAGRTPAGSGSARCRGGVAQAGGTGGADTVLGTGTPAVTQSESRDRDAGGVGGERGEPQAVGVGRAQLGAGVRAFSAGDQPHPLRSALDTLPSSSAPQAPSRISPPGSVAAVQAEAETFGTAWWIWSVVVMPTEYDSHLPHWASQATNSWVPPPESVRISVRRPRRYFFGSWARPSWAVVMWSTAVLLPALPGRSRPATGSPLSPVPGSTAPPNSLVAVPADACCLPDCSIARR